jgi:hypothetical protein
LKESHLKAFNCNAPAAHGSAGGPTAMRQFS